ncbi:MAG TPA: hypothetical protein VLA34_15580, partial [Candidatus Krumholzibacterium sp.]|nr:hypothetical protein [Candidatus Krumholzibacterium sp.]
TNPADDRFIGDYGIFPTDPANEVLLAELICPESSDQKDWRINPETGQRSPFWSTWNMMFRNIYSLGSAGLDDSAIEVRIEQLSETDQTRNHLHSATDRPFVQIFGLDQENSAENVREPDELIDDRMGIINYYYGYIQFPWFEPFNVPLEEMATYFADDNDGDGFGDPGDPQALADAALVLETLELNSLIYLDYKTEQPNPPNYYNIVIKTTSGSRVFQLNAFDIIEGSEVVSVDGRRLTRGEDYKIDYNSGTVSLMGGLENLGPDSKVSIEYQHTPLVGGGKTSLLGAGVNFNISTNSRVNASFIYNSVGTPKYNPRLGDEPTRTMAGDINGSFKFSPYWMTSMANLLPRVDTDANSSLTVSGEVAVSIPNPNTKGEAFLDDMEGVEDSDMLTMVRRLWYEASPPLDPFASA